MAKLINTAKSTADYLSLTYTETTQLVVELTALSLEKTSDKPLWIDNTPLVYTVRIKNNDTDPEGEPLENVTFEDYIDPAIALLDTGNVTVNGEQKTLGTDFDYNVATGMLTFNSLDDIPAGTTMEIIFPVTKA